MPTPTIESDVEDEPMDHNPEMLLSRVAEHVYWAGRYLERAEATARLVRTHTELFIDLPRSVGLGWTPLLA
ncbi:MAG: alpha-E domain-containing protein, partial [Acidimicrobiales bacterium]